MAADLTRIIGEAAETSHFIILRGTGSDFCVGRASMGKPPATPEEHISSKTLAYGSWMPFPQRPLRLTFGGRLLPGRTESGGDEVPPRGRTRLRAAPRG